MNQLYSFDDVLIEPIFSNVRSRKDVDLTTDFLDLKLSLPVVNSNMDTVASPALCKALAEYGTIGTLHRFWSIEENAQAFKDSVIGDFVRPIVSVGIGDYEFERAKALHAIGGNRIMLDVAHAANIAVVEMYNKLNKEFGDSAYYIVGDFGTGREIQEFLNRVDAAPDAVKVGISVGSVCVTRLTTGVGTPAFSCLQDCVETVDRYDTMKLVLDGGVHHIGDIAKAYAAGADLIISGSFFAGTEESAGRIWNGADGKPEKKEYRGSASHESYVVQNKVASWRAPEGRATMIPYKGPVIDVLNKINGGLRSACSYVNAFNLTELRSNTTFHYTTEKINHGK